MKRFVATALLIVALSQFTSVESAVSARSPAGSAAEEAPREKITVSFYPRANRPAITGMGYDLKQPGKAEAFTQAAADDLFGTSGVGTFTTMRVPVLAREAHAQEGYWEIAADSYAPHIAAIKRVASYNTRVTVFASLRLTGIAPASLSFPQWVKTGGQVDTQKYGRLLFDYLRFMDTRGINVDVLGPDNERAFNEGEITPARYDSIVTDVKRRLTNWNTGLSTQDPTYITRPKFIAPDNFNPDIGFLTGGPNVPPSITELNAWANVGLVGAHTYSKDRSVDLDALTSMGVVADQRNKPFWQTEFHSNESDCNQPTPECAPWEEWKVNFRAVYAAADNFDLGAVGFTWWSYKGVCPAGVGNSSWCDDSTRSRLQDAIANSTSGSRVLSPPLDQDSTEVGAGTFSTRAFRRGSTAYVWIVNDTANLYPLKGVDVAGWDVPEGYAGSTFQQWTRTGSGDVAWSEGVGAVNAVDDIVRFPVNPRSITILKLTGVTVP